MRLDELKNGQRAQVVRLKGRGSFRHRLMEMGLVRGAEVQMLREAPLGDPLEILIKGYNLSLRRDEASGIEVEVLT